jgi:voltage-gated potassium channel
VYPTRSVLYDVPDSTDERLTVVAADGSSPRALRARIRDLYEGTSRRSVTFRYALLGFDLLMITFIAVSSFFPGDIVIEVLDALFGLGVLAEFAARMWTTRSVRGELLSPAGVADIIVMISLLAPLVGESLAFLRAVRAFRTLRSYRLIERLRHDVPGFRRNQNIVLAALHLSLFIFVMTAVVYETQHHSNPAIANYADALYFTVATLTTTGFGDITLEGSWGRLLAVLIMIFGVSLFLNLAREMFRAPKVSWRCRNCGLTQHDSDAIHCKHCGRILHMPHESDV